MTPTRHAALILLALSAATTGCVEYLNPTSPALARLVFESVDKNELAARRARHDEARALYEARLATHREAIAAAKSDLASASGDLSATLSALDDLYGLTHPCGEDDCGTHPCPEEGGCLLNYRFEAAEVFIEREGLDQEVPALEAGMARVWELIDAYAEGRRFGDLDVLMSDYAAKIPFASKNAARFQARHAEVRTAWLEATARDAMLARKKRRHGEAALRFSKAADLAAALGETARAEEHLEAARAARAEVLSARGFTVSVSGSPELTRALLAYTGYAAEVRYVDGRARATVRLSEGAPSYARDVVNTTGSFEYVSGTRQVENPAWREKNRECESARGTVDSTYASCERFGYGTTQNINCQDGQLEREKRERDRICGDLSGIQQTISEDVMSTQEYPIRRHVLRTTLPIGLTLRNADGREGADRRVVTSTLTDDEHDAHSRNGAGVSADAANPPSKSAGYESAFRAGRDAAIAAIRASFAGYEAAMIAGARGAAEVDDLAAAALLDPSQVDPKHAARLETASGIPDAVSRLTALGQNTDER